MHRLVFFAAISEVCGSFMVVVSVLRAEALNTPDGGGDDTEADAFCSIQATCIQYFTLATALWIFFIGVTLFQIVIRRNRNTERLERYYHAVAWLTPIISCVYLNATDSFGPTGVWCWIKYDNDDDEIKTEEQYLWIYWMYGPLFILFLSNIYIYIAVNRELRRLFSRQIPSTLQTEKQQRSAVAASTPVTPLANPSVGVSFKEKVMRRLLMYVGTFIVCWTPGFLNNFYRVANPNPSMTLYALHALLPPLNGVVNAVIYGNTKKLRSAYSEWLCGDGNESHEAEPEESRPILVGQPTSYASEYVSINTGSSGQP
eukprot:TRINITY_DN2183_c0_g1_i1.p1 TRINITY_DN2183_c0_g1~~TRINITY_DN2183_c0_g1_i1.p1  ORF type:complete len:315 (+),score=66.67 TRINITY_DN2183_c0_g1_i1:206-1150(+)